MDEDANYVCTLDQASIKKAKEELNENPQDRLAAVKALRDWIKEQPHIKCPELDTNIMLQYLRGAKFSQLRARELFEKHLSLRNSFKWYKDIDTRQSELERVMRFGMVVPLPKRTPRGERVVIERPGVLDGKKFDFSHFFQHFIALFQYITSDEMSQVNGFIFLIDFTGMGPKLLTRMLNKEVGDFESKWAKSAPGRFKGFHMYNIGVLFEVVIAFAKPLLPKKWIDRMKTHDNLETVYKHIPMECLPEEYLPDDYTGPNVGSINQILDDYIRAVQEEKFREKVLYKTSTEFGVDETKRITEPQVQAHFRKLNVD